MIRTNIGKDYITMRINPINRIQKRKVKKHLEKVINTLADVEESFLTKLFDSSNTMNYWMLYSNHAITWMLNCQKLHDLGYEKYCEIQRLYFSEQYKPIENHA